MNNKADIISEVIPTTEYTDSIWSLLDGDVMMIGGGELGLVII
jgi:hypothetical protein